jgi:hypothetical protein
MQKLLLATLTIFLLVGCVPTSIEPNEIKKEDRGKISQDEYEIIDAIENKDQGQTWSPKIQLAMPDYYWGDSKNSLFKNEEAQKFIEFGDSFCTKQIGEGFFEEYFSFYPATSGISGSGLIYYLNYILIAPEKGIDHKTTTHPTVLSITVKKAENGFEITKGD